jgi:hypothetical protein
MELANVIAEIPEWENKTAAQLVTLLNSQSVVVIDDELYTWAGVALVIGSSGADALRIALEANGVSWAVYQLGGKGLQLSHPDVQAMLSQFAVAGVPGAATLSAKVSPCQHAGLPTATLNDVEAAVAFLRLQVTKEQMRQDGAARYNDYIDAIEEWDGSGNAPVL